MQKDEELTRDMNKLVDLGEDYEYPKGSINLVVAMEEMSELTKELSKWIRGKGDAGKIIEEIVDVSMSLLQLPYILDIQESDFEYMLDEHLKRKHDRLKDRIYEELKERKCRCVREACKMAAPRDLNGPLSYEYVRENRLSDDSIDQLIKAIEDWKIRKEKLSQRYAESIAALKEEKERRKQLQAEGIAAAKERGVKFGRPRSDRNIDITEVVNAWRSGEMTIEEIVDTYHISTSTFYRWVRMMKDTRDMVKKMAADANQDVDDYIDTMMVDINILPDKMMVDIDILPEED